MAENGKKWLVGTLSATAVAVGSFTYDLVKPALQEQIKRYAPDFFQSTKEMVAGKNGAAASDASAASAAPSASVPQTETMEEETESATTETESTTNAEDTAFNTAYDECNTETGNNPAIDLNNDMEVHRANLKCLIVNKNQGQTPRHRQRIARNPARNPQRISPLIPPQNMDMNLRISALLLACAVLSACGSTASRTNHTPSDQAGLQNACARHFANVADPFERGNRITACVRNRSRR